MIRLIIADDHAIVREGLKQLFKLVGDIHVAGEADSGAQLIHLLQDMTVDLVLLDLTMPGYDGIEIISVIRKCYPQVPLLVLSMHNESQIVLRALKAGAAGYLAKDNDPETLWFAIRKVAKGQRFIDPKLAERMAFDFDDEHKKQLHDALSEREFEILRLLALGKTVTDIGHQLCISNKTVSTHKARLFEKLAVNNTVELIRYYDAHDLANSH